MSDGSNSGAGKQTKYSGHEPYATPMKDGPEFSEIDFHSKYASVHPDMKGPSMSEGASKYPEVDSNELQEEDNTPAGTSEFWKGSGKDKSSIGDMGSTDGPIFKGKMPAGINIKRQI